MTALWRYTDVPCPTCGVEAGEACVPLPADLGRVGAARGVGVAFLHPARQDAYYRAGGR